MNIESVAFELNMDKTEMAHLEIKIENWFTCSYAMHERLFGDMDKTINLMNILQQIKGNAISIRISKYQAKVLSEVIFDMEKRMHVKTCDVYLPKDSRFYGLYHDLLKLAK